MVNPFFEVGLGRRIVVLDVVIQALETILWIKIIQPIFEWILYISALEKDLIVPPRAMNVAVQQGDHVVHHLLIAGKDDVRTSGIVGKAMFLNGKAVSSAALLFLQNFTVLFQMRCDTDAGQSAAKNSYRQSPSRGPFLLIHRKFLRGSVAH